MYNVQKICVCPTVIIVNCEPNRVKSTIGDKAILKNLRLTSLVSNVTQFQPVFAYKTVKEKREKKHINCTNFFLAYSYK